MPWGVRLLIPSALAGIVATAVDAGAFWVLLRTVAGAGTAAIGGAALGGVVGYLLQRRWVFASGDRPAGEVARYALVSGSSALVHGALVAILSGALPSAGLAWALSRIAVFVGWTFPGFRWVVFRAPRGHGGRVSRSRACASCRRAWRG